MKNICINLHVDKKRTLFIIVVFFFFSFMINIFIIIFTNADFAQLNSLWHSDYVYSAITQQPVMQDDYYKFDAGISFELSSNAKTSLNVDIVMQSLESEYTDSVYWNVNKLDIYDIAISKNIAKAYGLSIGDKLYSKNVVDGKVYEYVIDQILPEITSVRVMKEKNYSSNGIIIMGYDKQYINNITHYSIIFTKKSIEEMSLNISEMPENIIHRSDEIIIVCKKLLPYLLLFIMLSVLLTIGLVLFLVRYIKYNYKRLILLGFRKKELNKSYNMLICGTGAVSIVIVFFVSLFIFRFIGLCLFEAAFFSIIMLAEIVTLFLAAHFSKRQLWEK